MMHHGADQGRTVGRAVPTHRPVLMLTTKAESGNHNWLFGACAVNPMHTGNPDAIIDVA